MRNYPTLDPVVMASGVYYVDRLLDRGGRVEIGVGDTVTPRDVVARTGNIEKSFTLYLANELGVPNDSLKKYLAKSIGSSVNEGEPIARVRRGLRTAAVRSPASGTIVHVDDAEGTVTLSASTGPRELAAFVSGVVEQIHADRGVTIRTSGARVYGVVGFGDEAIGPLAVGSDRHDRELTVEQVSKDWAGSIVLAGMTVGVPALNRMREVGVAGVIAGSISEGDVRRFVASSNGSSAEEYWARWNGWSPTRSGSSMAIVVTEGFGRLPMADPVYEFLASKAGSSISMSPRTELGAQLARPEIYIDGPASDHADPASLDVGRAVRVVDPHRLGSVGTVQSQLTSQSNASGLSRDYVGVRFEAGDVELVPVENVEVLV